MKTSNEKPQSLMTMAQTTKKTTQCKSLIYKHIKEGKFPQPIKLGGRRIAFLESEIDEWIAERVKESRPCKAGV